LQQTGDGRDGLVDAVRGFSDPARVLHCARHRIGGGRSANRR
jgi:hypothetical protein